MQSVEREYFERFSQVLSKAFTSCSISYVGGNMLNYTVSNSQVCVQS